jgi:hypothetical protein
MAFLLMIGIALLAGGIYFFIAMATVPGAKEERFGTLEDLPADVGKWKVDETSEVAKAALKDEGLVREVRHFYHEPRGFSGAGRLVYQVRYRDAETRKIARIEPEQTVDRARD